MSKYRRGIANYVPAGTQVAEPTAKPIGRALDTRIGRQPSNTQSQAYEPGVILNQHGDPTNAPRRGIIRPGQEHQRVRGLGQATIDARVTQQQIDEGLTEQCTRCGQERLSKSMQVLVQGHYEPEQGGSSAQSIRICKPCKNQTYRNPQDGTTEEWQPQQQAVRFDEEGNPYDGSQVSLGTLVNGDTYHQGDLSAATEPTAMQPRFHSGRVGKVRG